MTAIGCALGLGFALAYLAWRDWLKLRTVVPPHEEVKAEVAKLRQDVDACKMALGVERLDRQG
jgi:hypothetical protein